MTKALLWILLTGLGFIDLAAQSTTYSFRHLRTGDGLSDNVIYSITQDKYGFIWIASNYGLNKFNGYNVENFSAHIDSTTIPNMVVRGLLATQTGNLYIATQSGLCIYSYERNEFKRTPYGIDFFVGKMIEASQGILWMHSARGIIIVDEKKGIFTALSDHKDTSLRRIAKTHVYDFATDRHGNLFLGTNAGLFKINLASCHLEVFKHDKNDPRSISSDEVRNVIVDQQGTLWASTRYYGSILDKYNEAQNSFSHYEDFRNGAKGWADNRIMDLLTDRNGNLWIASLRAGLAVYKPGAGLFDFFFNDPMLTNSIGANGILCLFEDNKGMLWMGTDGYGVDYFQPGNNQFTTIRRSYFQMPTLIDNSCRAVAEDDKGNLWIATYKGISYLDRQKARYTNYLLAQNEESEANNSVRSVVIDEDKTVWIGTGAGLNKWSPATQNIQPVNREDSIPQVFISQVMKDREHTIWVCTVRGLFRYDRKTRKFENMFRRPELLPYRNRNATNIFQDSKGKYWISLPYHGIIAYDPVLRKAEFFSVKVLEPLASDNYIITSIGEDSKGVIWMSSLQGLVGFNTSTRQFQRLGKENGLPSLKTSCLLIDSLDRIWFGSSNGLCMVDRSRKQVYRFDENDGLPTTYFYEGTAQRMRNGYFAYATYQGMVFFRPGNISPERSNTPVLLTSFKLQGKDWKDSIATEELRQLDLNHDQNYFSFEITGLHFNNPSKILYAYKLEGFDEDWQVTNSRIVNYTNVPGGNYTFRYKASVNANLASIPGKQIHISIGTVFYKTWWFLILTILFIGVVIYFFVKNKLRQRDHIHNLETRAQSLEKEKAMVMYENLQQQLNPHFLFNSLTSLRSLIKMNPDHAGNFLDKMSAIYRYILQNRDIELVSLKEEIVFVQSYINLQQTRFGNGLKVEIRVPEEYFHLKIVPVTLQNLIENAIKHNLVDCDAPLKIELFVEDNYLVIRNNLQKKQFVETSNKQGLKNLGALYEYLDPRRVTIIEEDEYFTVKVPLI